MEKSNFTLKRVYLHTKGSTAPICYLARVVSAPHKETSQVKNTQAAGGDTVEGARKIRHNDYDRFALFAGEGEGRG